MVAHSIIRQEGQQDKNKSRNGGTSSVSVRMATDTLTMASRKTSDRIP
nr:MAG TPA: hypothetical protein [Caudoviricetes sp.]